MQLLWSMALSLALTLAVEVPFAALWGLRGRDLSAAAWAQALTNPAVVLLWNVARAYVPLPLWAVTAALESAAVLTEGRVYARCTAARRPLLLSLCANGLSYSIGLLLNQLF